METFTLANGTQLNITHKMSAKDYGIFPLTTEDKIIIAGGRITRALRYDYLPSLQRNVARAETSADREFWQTQIDVLQDVQTAINERIKPKEKTKNE